MKNKLTMRNACAVIILLHISNSIILGFPSRVGSDSWIVILLSLIPTIPLMLLYGRLVHLMPGKNLFGMLQAVFGKTTSSILCIVYAFYFITLTGIVRGNYSEFVRLTSLFNTPFVLINLAFFAVCSFLAVSGAETIGKWCSIMIVLGITTYIAITLFSVPRMHANNLLPIMQNSPILIAKESLKEVTLPMGESIVILCLIDGLDKKASPYKTFVFSCVTSAVFLAVIFIQNCAILGPDLMEKSYFPSYKAASVLHIGSIGTRVESIVAFVFVLAGVSKIAASLIASSKAVAGIFQIQNHHPLILPVGFFSVAVSAHVFRNIVEMFGFLDVYVIYAVPFQILIPLVTWIVAEIKAKKSGAPLYAPWRDAPQNAQP